ncbi:transposase, partial [Streptomyces sp. NPDC004393]
MELYAAMPRRADALFELVDAVLCAGGPVVSLPELSLEGVHRRGHGAMYDALARGRLDVSRLRWVLAGLKLPRGTDGQISIALDVTPWPRPDAECSPDRAALPPSVPLRRSTADHPRVVLAGKLIRPGQAACWYSWSMPPSRSRLRTSRRRIRAGSLIGSGNGRSGRAL